MVPATRLDALPDEAQASPKKALLHLYLLVQHKREAEELADLLAVLDEAVGQHYQEGEEAKMTGAEVLLRQGRNEGRDEERQGDEKKAGVVFCSA